MEWDLNPRDELTPPTRFPIVLLRPLGHPSIITGQQTKFRLPPAESKFYHIENQIATTFLISFKKVQSSKTYVQLTQ